MANIEKTLGKRKQKKKESFSRILRTGEIEEKWKKNGL